MGTKPEAVFPGIPLSTDSFLLLERDKDPSPPDISENQPTH